MFGSEPTYLHLITICVGLLIAFGLQQIVNLFLRRRRERKHQASDTAPPKPPTDRTL